MRMGLLIAAIVIAILLVGCAWLGGALSAPREGQYTYTNKGEYLGPSARQIPIWVDKNFGSSDKVAIDDAVNTWNYALNGFITLKIVDLDFDMEVSKITERVKGNGWIFMKIGSDNPMIPIQGSSDYRTIGFTERVGGNHLYLVRERISNEDIFGVTLHEIGHLLGAEHRGDKLMHPHFTRVRFRCIDLETIKQVAEYNHIPVDRLNFCVDIGDISSIINDRAKVTESITCPK